MTDSEECFHVILFFAPGQRVAHIRHPAGGKWKLEISTIFTHHTGWGSLFFIYCSIRFEWRAMRLPHPFFGLWGGGSFSNKASKTLCWKFLFTTLHSSICMMDLPVHQSTNKFKREYNIKKFFSPFPSARPPPAKHCFPTLTKFTRSILWKTERKWQAQES